MLARLKGNGLPKACTLALVNLVLIIMPIYWMLFYKLPSWVIRRIDNIKRNFLWKRRKGGSSINNLVAWENV